MNSLFWCSVPQAPYSFRHFFRCSDICFRWTTAFDGQIAFPFCCFHFHRFAVHIDMDITIRSGYSAFHPFQSSQHRSNSKLFISFFYRFHSQIIFALQVDRTRSPGMAQTLSIRTAIHGKMLRSGFFRVIFFPEGGGAFL